MQVSESSLVGWFVKNGGIFNADSVTFREDAETGRGAFALRDIKEGENLFTIPRSLLLSTRTCTLRKELGEDAWSSLGKGWASLILCIMWEQSKGPSGKWAPYLDILPTTFTTPMFWSSDELSELEGTTVTDKIGKEEADEDYRARVVPIISSRPDLFLPSTLDTYYTLENFHRIGSNILSRSFHVEEWDPEKNEGEDHDDSDGGEEHEHDDHDDHDEIPHAVPSADVEPPADSAMEIDGEPGHEPEGEAGRDGGEEEEDDDDEDLEDTGDVSMVPMADMLNARYESDNARLFYEETSVSMVSTKPIKAGEQIWNTYGDPPNSDLLRRYGHIDMIALPSGVPGNPADVVEIKANLAVEVVAARNGQERIDWWLEEGGDDVFVIEAQKAKIPEGLVSLLKLLLLSPAEWKKAQEKGKPPKGKLDTPEVFRHAITTLDRRLGLYRSTIEEDTKLLSEAADSLPRNKRNAIVVRLGEKLILSTVLKGVRSLLASQEHKKRKEAGGGEGRNSKRARR